MRLRLYKNETILNELKRRGFDIYLIISEQDIHDALATYNKERELNGLEPFMFEFYDPKTILNNMNLEEIKTELIKMNLIKFFENNV